MYRYSIHNDWGIMKLRKAVYASSHIVIWLLVAIALVGVTLVAPLMSTELATIPDYANDRWAIQFLISLPVVIGMAILLEVLYLLKLTYKNQMFTEQVFKWVRLLAGTCFGLTASCVSLGAWLTYKNTFPPGMLIVVAVSTLLALAVALVTTSLLGLLRNATANANDLEGVI
jgi:hypothetical protein